MSVQSKNCWVQRQRKEE